MEGKHPDKSLKPVTTENGRSDREATLKAQQRLVTRARKPSEEAQEDCSRPGQAPSKAVKHAQAL